MPSATRTYRHLPYSRRPVFTFRRARVPVLSTGDRVQYTCYHRPWPGRAPKSQESRNPRLVEGTHVGHPKSKRAKPHDPQRMMLPGIFQFFDAVHLQPASATRTRGPDRPQAKWFAESVSRLDQDRPTLQEEAYISRLHQEYGESVQWAREAKVDGKTNADCSCPHHGQSRGHGLGKHRT
jgi:hypothetical protein